MKKATLILGAAPRVVVPIARSLQKIGVSCIVGTFSEKNSALGSNAVRRSARLPHPDNRAALLSALTSLIDEENIDTIFPGSDLAMIGVGDHYDRLAELVYPGCPPPDVCAAVLEKRRTFEAARTCGIEMPAQRSPADSRSVTTSRSMNCGLSTSRTRYSARRPSCSSTTAAKASASR